MGERTPDSPPSDAGAPPPYQTPGAGTNDAPPPDFDVTSAFANLTLAPGPNPPTADSCLAHLKLLYAFQTLKEEVGYTDGLWGLWNSRAEGIVRIQRQDDEGNVSEEVKDVSKDPAAAQVALSQVREKRWALYVARAVDRYEAWWRSMRDGPPLTMNDMDKRGNQSYDLFPDAGSGSLWTLEQLPPLGKDQVFDFSFRLQGC